MLAPASTDVASWQWLDADGGQPAPERQLGIRHAGAEPRAERGGTLLLINRKTLLDVARLSARPMIAYTTENVNRAGRYNASNEPARALSPARTQHVLVGSQRLNDKFEYALVAMRHDTGEAYAVPFDRNALRFESASDATPDWIARNFEWGRDSSGAERLALRKDAKPAPWLGRFIRFDGGMVDYRLEPTNEAMLGTLHEFVVREFGALPDSGPQPAQSGDGKAILVEGRALRLFREPNARRTSIYAESAGGVKPAWDLVEKVGKRFNEELARGRHQQHFTGYAE